MNRRQTLRLRAKLRRRRNLPLWGILLIWLVMSAGFMVYNWFLVRQDEAIAPRQQVVLGSITAIHHGKSDTASYSFTYEGREFHGSQIVSPDQYFGSVAVYFDSAHPSTSSLVDYRRKAKLDHSLMVGCGYTSVGLAVVLAFVLYLKKAKEGPAPGSEQFNSL